MKTAGRLGFLLFFVFFLTVPIFAAEDAAEDLEQKEKVIEDIMSIEEQGEGVVIGEVVSLDTASGVIVLKIQDGEKEAFSVVEDETILWKGIEDIELADINKGDRAEIGYYREESGKLIASWVDLLVEE